jgi:hypothetical protein
MAQSSRQGPLNPQRAGDAVWSRMPKVVSLFISEILSFSVDNS